MPATPAAPAAPASPQTATPAAPANPAPSVASIVDTEFPAYDANKDGQLDQPEFTRWMVALKSQEMKATGSTLPPEQVTAWANGAFATADKDKSLSISKSELVTYLSGGAA
jgi:Ca2+-binding EF-hand superfamily protein